MGRGSDSKDMRDLLNEVEKFDGWRVERYHKGWKVYPPSGAPMTVTHGPKNPWRQRRNTIAKLRRAGAPI